MNTAKTVHLSQTFTFDAAHTLERSVPLKEYAPSMRVHGHTYHAEVVCAGEIGASGMLTVMEKLAQPGRKRARVIDLFVLRQEISRVQILLDHHLLDEVPGLVKPTLECLCVFIAEHIRLPVAEVAVWRADGGKCVTVFGG